MTQPFPPDEFKNDPIVKEGNDIRKFVEGNFEVLFDTTQFFNIDEITKYTESHYLHVQYNAYREILMKHNQPDFDIDEFVFVILTDSLLGVIPLLGVMKWNFEHANGGGTIYLDNHGDWNEYCFEAAKIMMKVILRFIEEKHDIHIEYNPE